MIRVKIEIHPYGSAEMSERLFLLEICNVGGTHQRGHYQCTLYNEKDDTTQLAHIRDWPRLERDAAALVHEALSQMGYGREV